jgi:hypothetical protein
MGRIAEQRQDGQRSGANKENWPERITALTDRIH